MRRRRFVAGAAGLGATLLAGCSRSDGAGGGGSGEGGGGSGGTSSFRLLISDQPAAIGDFDSLEVTLSAARVFRADEDEELTPTVVDETPESTDSTPAGTPEGTDEEDDEDEDEDEDEDGEGFVEFDLDSVTVDLTRVVGDRALPVLEGELETGRYSGIELRVADVEGVVDGEAVEVMVPSNRLRIVKPFEVREGEELSFVFDINVVKRGPNGYNLLPVIGESGVTGDDVDVEEVDDDGDSGDSGNTTDGEGGN